jgi:hypothetical protein
MSNRGSNSARAPGWDRLRAIDVNISELSPAPDHARRHPAAQIRDLARAIETFGFNTPVVIDEENRLLAGHARVEAVRRRGWPVTLTTPRCRTRDAPRVHCAFGHQGVSASTTSARPQRSAAKNGRRSVS